MFIRVKDKPNGKKSIQIVESYRRGDKVSQRIIRHIGQAVSDSEVEVMKQLAESIIIETKNTRQPVLPFFAPEDIYGKNTSKLYAPQDTVLVSDLREEQRIIEGIGDVFGKLYDDLGCNDLLGKQKNKNAILKACVLARIANPVSKMRTASLLEEDYGITLPLEKIYRMMDILSEHEKEVKEHIGQRTLALFREHVDVLFFDVTTLYFESIEKDELRANGFSKDNKINETQIVIALVTTTQGLPITYEIFPGNTYEGHTFIETITKLKERFDVRHVQVVADRGMFNEANLQAMEKEGIEYIVAARLKNLPKAMKEKIMESRNYRGAVIHNEFHWLGEYEYNNRRLIVGYSSSRARKDRADRQRLIERLMKKVKEGKIKLRTIISNQGTKRFLSIIKDEAHINEAKISEDAGWDGLHGVITNANTHCTREELISRYRELWQIEEAFRINKHDLKMRPIYHWTPKRIKAHIALCFIAYTLVKQALYRSKLQKMFLSFEQLRNELLHVQSSILIHLKTKKKYRLPSKVTQNQKSIYRIFGLKRSEVPHDLA